MIARLVQWTILLVRLWHALPGPLVRQTGVRQTSVRQTGFRRTSVSRTLAVAAYLLALLVAAPLAAGQRTPLTGIDEENGLVGVPRGQVYYRLWRLEGRTRGPVASAKRPLIVYLHGGPGANGTVFRHAVGALIVRTVGDVLFIDQRGCGHSPTKGLVARDFTLERFTDDTRRVLSWVYAQHPDLPRAVVVGHSFGAGLAVLLARDYPGLVARVVLLSPALDYRDLKYHAYLAMKDRAEREGDAEHLEHIREMEELHPPGSESESELFTTALSGARFGFDARRFAGAEEADLYRILAARDGEQLRVAEHWRAFVAADRLDRKDLTPELVKLTTPVLVLGGQEDFLTPPASLTRISVLTPGSRLQLMPAAGHHPYLVHPEAFVQALAGFILP